MNYIYFTGVSNGFLMNGSGYDGYGEMESLADRAFSHPEIPLGSKLLET